MIFSLVFRFDYIFRKRNIINVLFIGVYFMYLNMKQVVDNQLKIDIRDFKKQGLTYDAELTGTMSIRRNGQETDSISIAINAYLLILRYLYKSSEDKVKRIRQEIKLDWLKCHYGGQRVYFICPQCGKRVESLYMIHEYFSCRTCCNLIYKSQQEDRADRLLRKVRKIRRKLDADDNLWSIIWNKPKGMHHKTFDRLVEQVNIITNAHLKEFLP